MAVHEGQRLGHEGNDKLQSRRHPGGISRMRRFQELYRTSDHQQLRQLSSLQ
jgi:hypothetical protein